MRPCSRVITNEVDRGIVGDERCLGEEKQDVEQKVEGHKTKIENAGNGFCSLSKVVTVSVIHFELNFRILHKIIHKEAEESPIIAHFVRTNQQYVFWHKTGKKVEDGSADKPTGNIEELQLILHDHFVPDQSLVPEIFFSEFIPDTKGTRKKRGDDEEPTPAKHPFSIYLHLPFRHHFPVCCHLLQRVRHCIDSSIE